MLSVNHVIVFPVVSTDHESVIVAKVDEILVCHTYPLIPIPVSTEPLRSKLIVHVANNVPFAGESSIGVVGLMVSCTINTHPELRHQVFHTISNP